MPTDLTPSPTPWSVKRTGSEISILDANKKVVIRKIVSQCSIEQYHQLSNNFDFIVESCNQSSRTLKRSSEASPESTMKDFGMSSERVGRTILDGVRIPGEGCAHDDYACAEYLAKLLADLVNETLEPKEAERARNEVKRLYSIGMEMG